MHTLLNLTILICILKASFACNLAPEPRIYSEIAIRGLTHITVHNINDALKFKWSIPSGLANITHFTITAKPMTNLHQAEVVTEKFSARQRQGQLKPLVLETKYDTFLTIHFENRLPILNLAGAYEMRNSRTSQPLYLHPKFVGQHQMNLSWTAPEIIDGVPSHYCLYISDGKQETYICIPHIITQVSVPNLTSDTEYSFCVQLFTIAQGFKRVIYYGGLRSDVYTRKTY